MEFEWDEKKSIENNLKHGVTFDEAKTVFKDAFSITILDPDHSDDETRYLDLGYSDQGRLLIVVYTQRGDHIRLISSRLATNVERKTYEQDN